LFGTEEADGNTPLPGQRKLVLHTGRDRTAKTPGQWRGDRYPIHVSRLFSSGAG
jgi:hypothetical protein